MTQHAPLDPAPGRPLANGRIVFAEVNATAVAVRPPLVRRWAPQGGLRGNEWVARLNGTRRVS